MKAIGPGVNQFRPGDEVFGDETAEGRGRRSPVDGMVVPRQEEPI
jgi:NADPH:quinone reductase-like Zn-dependent oxidoreductase